jgi:hypothetical protein
MLKLLLCTIIDLLKQFFFYIWCDRPTIYANKKITSKNQMLAIRVIYTVKYNWYSYLIKMYIHLYYF